MKFILSLFLILSSSFATAEQLCGQVKVVKSLPNNQTVLKLIDISVGEKTMILHPTEWARVSSLVLAALSNAKVQLCIDTKNVEVQVTNLQ